MSLFVTEIKASTIASNSSEIGTAWSKENMGCDFKVMKLIFPHWLVDFSDYFLVMHCISSEAKLTLLAESFM